KQADVDAALGDFPIYTLDYLVDGHAYRYQTVHSGDVGRYFGLLFEDATLVSMHRVNDGYRPGLRECERFPYPKDFDSVDCMRRFTADFVSLGAMDPADLSTPDEAAKAKARDETI